MIVSGRVTVMLRWGVLEGLRSSRNSTLCGTMEKELVVLSKTSSGHLGVPVACVANVFSIMSRSQLHAQTKD